MKERDRKKEIKWEKETGKESDKRRNMERNT